MTVLVDTSVWSLALRRRRPPDDPHVRELRRVLLTERVATTGIIVQELLYGVTSSSAQEQIHRQFASLDYVTPSYDDHVAAARLHYRLRSAGVQVSSADALIAHLAIARDLILLTTDQDFYHAAPHVPLHVWAPGGGS